MYQAESEVKVKKKILDALFVGGAADKISDLAQNEKDAGLRRAAIEKLGLLGSEATAATLLKMYANEKEKEELYESVRATYEHQTDPRYAAARLWVDAIIDPAHTRDALTTALDAAALNPEVREFKTGVLQT